MVSSCRCRRPTCEGSLPATAGSATICGSSSPSPSPSTSDLSSGFRDPSRLQVSRLSSPHRGSRACCVSAPGGLSSWHWVRPPAPQGLCTCLPSWPGFLGALEAVAQVSGDVFLTLNLDQGLEKLAPNTVLSVWPMATRPHPSPCPSLCYSI